jgi:hypothetical protein
VTLDNLVELAFPPEAMESVAEWAGPAHAAAIRAAATAVPRSPFSQAFSAGVTALLRDEAGLEGRVARGNLTPGLPQNGA